MVNALAKEKSHKAKVKKSEEKRVYEEKREAEGVARAAREKAERKRAFQMGGGGGKGGEGGGGRPAKRSKKGGRGEDMTD